MKKSNIFEFVDARKAELLKICSNLIKIPSVTPAQNESMLDYVCAWLHENKIPYEVVRSPENVPSIVFEVGNSEGDMMIMDGHNDVVSPGNLDKWDFSPYSGEYDEQLMYGRGTSDMKCGTGIILAIAKWINEGQLKFKGKMRGFIVHDEEIGGENGTLYLLEQGYAEGAQYCLVPEPTSYNNIEVGQKGSMRINFTAKAEHNGSILPCNKIIKLIPELNNLSEISNNLSEHYQDVYDNSVKIIKDAFDAPEVEKAISNVNVRINNIWMEGEDCHLQLATLVPVFVKTQQVIDQIEYILAKDEFSGITVEYPRCKESAHTEVDTALVKSAVANAEAITGKTVLPAWQWATSDCKFFRYLGIPAIQYGPAITEGIHSYNERVYVQEIVDTCKTYLAIMQDLNGFEE